VRILITGGAGFVGSHLTDTLLEQGHRVRILDSLVPQVHGPGAQRPAYLAADAELIRGDVRDRAAVAAALRGVDAVYHFAARVGVGQSMYEIVEYTAVNTQGTAVLLEALFHRPVSRLIVASSMSIYGEGRCRTASGAAVDPPDRCRERLARGQWEPRSPDGAPLEPCATPEDKRPSLASIYALTKYDQERMCLMFGSAYGMPTVALRFFNIYGTRQALSNPYTGVLAIFASRLLNGQPPLVFEDGRQRRDFVSVHDVARACALALEAPGAVGRALNIGSGKSFIVREVATALAAAVGKPRIEPQITGKYRVGDIRHCFADISAARECLGYEPRVQFEQGLVELAEWLRGQVAIDRVATAAGELAERGLTI
jgi:dTDP-L-rhamnose 4-epimerase